MATQSCFAPIHYSTTMPGWGRGCGNFNVVALYIFSIYTVRRMFLSFSGVWNAEGEGG